MGDACGRLEGRVDRREGKFGQRHLLHVLVYRPEKHMNDFGSVSTSEVAVKMSRQPSMLLVSVLYLQ